MRILTGIFEVMEARRRRDNAIASIIFGLGCLSCIVIGIVFIIVTTIMNAVETSTVVSTYGETYANACQPVPAGSDSLDNMPDTASPRAMLLLIADTQRRHEWHSQLPEQWRAENESEVELIACVERDWVRIETCEYSRASDDYDSGSYTVSIYREQELITITIINPETSRRIDSREFSGTEPDECPEDDGKFGTGNSRGDAVEWDEVAAWFEGYVFD